MLMVRTDHKHKKTKQENLKRTLRCKQYMETVHILKSRHID